MNRRFYMIVGATAALVQDMLNTQDRAYVNPAVLEVLGVAVRKGLDSPAKVAFAHRSSEIRSRVLIHQRFAERIGDRATELVGNFQATMRAVDLYLTFRAIGRDND